MCLVTFGHTLWVLIQTKNLFDFGWILTEESDLPLWEHNPRERSKEIKISVTKFHQVKWFPSATFPCFTNHCAWTGFRMWNLPQRWGVAGQVPVPYTNSSTGFTAEPAQPSPHSPSAAGGRDEQTLPPVQISSRALRKVPGWEGHWEPPLGRSPGSCRKTVLTLGQLVQGTGCSFTC